MSRNRSRVLVLVLLCGMSVILCGCSSPAPSQSALVLSTVHKEVVPAALGECSYHAELEAANNGTVQISSAPILVEVFDPDLQKVAARTQVVLEELQPGETRTFSVDLSAHCRQNYTLRVFSAV